MKRILWVALLVAFTMSAVFPAESTSGVHGYEPYREEEFPPWAHTLRRGESIFFGSLPISFTVVSLGYSAATAFGAKEFSNEPIALFSLAAAVSVIIAVTDYLLGVTGP